MSLKVTNPQTKSTISAASLASHVFYSFSLLRLVLQSAAVLSLFLLFCCSVFSHKQRSQHTLNWQLCLRTQSYKLIAR